MMERIIRLGILAALGICMLLFLTGCEDNTVMKCIAASEAYTGFDAIEEAEQPEKLTANEDVYASIYFIESPKGMKYSAQWYIDGAAVLAEERAMETDAKGIIVYKLPAEYVTGEKLKIRVLYRDKPVFDKEWIIE